MSAPMTLNEFRCWLDGFKEAFSNFGHPSKEQWQKIEAKLADVADPPRIEITHPITPIKPSELGGHIMPLTKKEQALYD